MAWYNDYRPTKFDEVIGQNLVKTVLQNALKQDKIKHGYLLSGPKGVGKTTIARIFANELNKIKDNPQASMDIIELDAASNSGVDNIRQLIDSAQTPPFAGRYKVFIIDEVHMLSKSAMNALLKILEEPPIYLVFLLATTNPEKLLPTVLSRLTKLALTSHSIDDIVAQLEMISKKENLIIDKDSLILIAKRSSGGQRDAINLLETLSSYGLDRYSIKETSNLLGLVSSEIFDQVSEILLQQNFTSIKSIIQEIENIGLDGEGFLAQFLDYLLESIFSEPTQAQQLILPVATILDMKLPINTIHSSFALIQAEITKNNFVSTLPKPIPAKEKSNSVKELTEKKTEFLEETITDIENPATPETLKIETSTQEEENTSSEPRLNTKEIEDGVEGLELQEISNNVIEVDQLQSTESEKEIPSNNDSNIKDFLALTEPKLKDYLKEILQLKNCPPPLKIVSNDINIEEIRLDFLTISISSPIFLPQLKNEKTINFIQQFIQEKTGSNYQIKVILRDPSLKNPVPEKKKEIGQDAENVLESSLENVLEPTHTKKEKIFYKIYGEQMPENNISDTNNLKFYSGEIPLPEIKTHSDTWNAEIGNIFDF
jgi:DNA polymerase III subunit gamma/tau